MSFSKFVERNRTLRTKPMAPDESSLGKRAIELNSPRAIDALGIEDESSSDRSKASDEAAEAAPSSNSTLRRASSLRQYLDEIGQYARLSVDEEVAVAREARAGDLAARERMINSNLKLVVKIAHDFEGYGMPVCDLINEGNIGLMKAVDHFDPDRGVRFSTYSAYWIKQSVKRCLSNQSRTVRIPIHMVEKISKLNQAVHSFKERFGREPSDQEIGAELGLELVEVRAIQRAQTRAVSLDGPVDDERAESLQDRLPDESATSPFAQLELQNSIHRMCEMLDRLQERDSTILRERFGLEGQTPKTLEEVGREFGVTRERIRQLQNEALVKLRNLVDDWGSQTV